MSGEEDNRPTSYMVIPRKDYENLYNRQYTQLTTLKKKLDPDKKHKAFFETTLKTHYPKVYQDMIRNDYILTRPTAIQQASNVSKGDSEKAEQVQMTMQRQLDDVVSGRQRRIKLSHPIYFFTRRYLDHLVKDSSLSLSKCQLLYHHLNNYAKHLPVYINRPLRKVEQATQNTAQDIERATNPPIIVNDDDDDNKTPPRRNRQCRRQLQSEIRRLREQQQSSPRTVGVRKEVQEGVKSEGDPSPTWMDRLRKRHLAKKH